MYMEHMHVHISMSMFGACASSTRSRLYARACQHVSVLCVGMCRARACAVHDCVVCNPGLAPPLAPTPNPGRALLERGTRLDHEQVEGAAYRTCEVTTPL